MVGIGVGQRGWRGSSGGGIQNMRGGGAGRAINMGTNGSRGAGPLGVRHAALCPGNKPHASKSWALQGGASFLLEPLATIGRFLVASMFW